MIKLLRVDKRLLHGQVAFTWTASVGAAFDHTVGILNTLHQHQKLIGVCFSTVNGRNGILYVFNHQLHSARFAQLDGSEA